MTLIAAPEPAGGLIRPPPVNKGAGQAAQGAGRYRQEVGQHSQQDIRAGHEFGLGCNGCKC